MRSSTFYSRFSGKTRIHGGGTPKELLHGSQFLASDATGSPFRFRISDFEKPCQGLDNLFGIIFARREHDFREEICSLKICQGRFSKKNFFSKTALP
jgi:hypothetical protein